MTIYPCAKLAPALAGRVILHPIGAVVRMNSQKMVLILSFVILAEMAVRRISGWASETFFNDLSQEEILRSDPAL
jgi:hypothetical protein